LVKKRILNSLLVVCLFLICLLFAGCSKAETNVSTTSVRTASVLNSEGIYKIIDNKFDIYRDLDSSKVPSKYNEAFFESNFLVAFRIDEYGYTMNYDIESYVIENKILTINVATSSKQEASTSEGAIIFLELPIDKLEDFETVKILKDKTDVTRTSDEDINFYPSEATELNKDKILDAYNEMTNSSNEVKAFYNYMPKEYSDKYKFDAVEIVNNNEDSEYYIYYDGCLVNAFSQSITATSNSKFKGFVHFSITDLNNDGYYELLSSTGYENIIHKSNVEMLDSKIKKSTSLSSALDKYLFFYQSLEKGFSIYGSNDNNIDNIDTHFITLKPNELKVNFKENEYMLESDNYFVKIVFDRYLLDIAVGNLAFSCNAIMTYTGETFTYTSPFTYLEGASVDFIDGENSMNSNFASMDAFATYTVETNQVIDRTYTYYPQKPGTYDMKVSYRGETIIVEDVLIIE